MIDILHRVRTNYLHKKNTFVPGKVKEKNKEGLQKSSRPTHPAADKDNLNLRRLSISHLLEFLFELIICPKDPTSLEN